MENILINNAVLKDALGLDPAEPFECYSIGHIGFIKHSRKKMLVFCDSEKYLDAIAKSKDVHAVLCDKALEKEIVKAKKIAIISNDPKNDFQKMRDYLARKNYKKYKSIVDETSQIASSASVSDFNVKIGKDVVIQPNVTILPGVEIGDECFIGSGTVLGAAFDAKISKFGNITNNFHDGKLIINNGVEIHSSCVLDRGNSFHGDTVIGENCKISHQTYIGHSSVVGVKTFIMAQVSIAGGVKIGDFVTIDPGVSVCSYVEIGNHARISTGSVVAFNVEPHARMTGNFAIPHSHFMSKFLNSK